MMNELVQLFVHQHNLGQKILSPLREEIEEDHPVVAHDPNKLHVIIPKVTVQPPDFGGSLTMPHYGYRRPSADCFNSYLIVQNFVIADITDGTNNINGSDTYRHLCNSSEKEAVQSPMCNRSNLTGIKNFSSVDRSEWSMKTLQLA